MSQFSIIKSPVNQHGFQLGQKVSFTERAYTHPAAPVTLKGTGTIIGWSRHPSGQIVVAPETVQIDASRGRAFKGFYDGQDARPFKASELVSLADILTGRKSDSLIADDIGADARTKEKPFKVGDLVERTHYSHPAFGELRKHYPVLDVGVNGDIRVIEDGLYGSKARYKLIKTREQIALDKVIHRSFHHALDYPPHGVSTATAHAAHAPDATNGKSMKYRVLSLDGATASSRTWDKLEDAL
eukprot:gene24911-28160_t